MHLCVMVLTFSLNLALAVSGQQADGNRSDSVVMKDDLSIVLARHTHALMAITGVVGTGEGVHRGKPCVIVFVEKKTSALTRKIPQSLEGYKVVIRPVGKVKALK